MPDILTTKLTNHFITLTETFNHQIPNHMHPAFRRVHEWTKSDQKFNNVLEPGSHFFL